MLRNFYINVEKVSIKLYVNIYLIHFLIYIVRFMYFNILRNLKFAIHVKALGRYRKHILDMSHNI